MSGFLLLHADRTASVIADDPIVPAGEVARLADTLALLQSADQLREQAQTASAAAVEQARLAGYRDGQEAARADSNAALAAELARLAVADTERARQQAADLARLALEVVRRIAGDVGSVDFVAGLAEKAAQTLAADRRATVHVHPDALDAVRERLASQPLLAVEADATLMPTDCVLATPLGRTHAGLETQLALLADAWEAAR